MKIKFDFKELDKKLESLSGNVPLDELLNSNFMRKFTQFQTAQEFADTSSFDFSNIGLSTLMIWINLFPRIPSSHLGKKCLIMLPQNGFKSNFNF
jgi:hypothetical protein